MKDVLVIVFLIGLLTLNACGKKSGSSNSKRITTISEEQIQALMSNQIFECASIEGKRCPEGIARLLILNKENAENSAVCSGFMVNEDTLITNQHCIPSEAVCTNTFVAIYDGYSYHQSKCSSIVKILNDYSDPNDLRKQLDVAIVKIDRPYLGKAFRKAANEVGSEILTAWVVDHTGLDKKEPNLFESRITELRCKVSSDKERESLILENCPVIDGNSGSPLVNASNEVVGIIWGGTGTKLRSDLDLEIRRSLFEEAAATEARLFKSFISL